jgi:hypothetical protein
MDFGPSPPVMILGQSSDRGVEILGDFGGRRQWGELRRKSQRQGI